MVLRLFSIEGEIVERDSLEETSSKYSSKA